MAIDLTLTQSRVTTAIREYLGYTTADSAFDNLIQSAVQDASAVVDAIVASDTPESIAAAKAQVLANVSLILAVVPSQQYVMPDARKTDFVAPNNHAGFTEFFSAMMSVIWDYGKAVTDEYVP